MKKSWTIKQQLSQDFRTWKMMVTASVRVTRNADLPQIFIECTALQRAAVEGMRMLKLGQTFEIYHDCLSYN